MRIMRLSLFITLITVVQLSATNLYSQTAKLSVKISNGELTELFDAVESQSDFYFLYNEKYVDTDKKISIDVDNSSISGLLDRVFLDSNIQYEIDNKQIILSPSDMTQQKGKTIIGTVKDSDGIPISGTNILVKGTLKGVISDQDGNYKINNVEEGATLIYSFIGMKPAERPVAGKSSINVTLAFDAVGLEEVIAVGYGTMRKSDVAGAIAVVSAEDLLDRPSFNALQGLKGKASGVNIFSNSGSPTGSPRIMIRGIGTVNSSSNPLYVVDGVATDDITYMNPNDIERMEVLKDASATAIYGARGANGVLLITTKRGAKKGETIVSYDGFISIGNLTNKMDLMNSTEWMEAKERAYANVPQYETGAEVPTLTRSDKNLFNDDGTPKYDTDWQEEATRTAVSNNNQLSIQQGNEKSSLGLFLNYARNEGIMINSWMNRTSAKATYDVTPRDWFKVGFNMLYNKTKENEAEEDGGHQMPRRSMIEMVPIFPVKFDDGTWSSSQTIEDDYGLEGMANPVHVLSTQERLRSRSQFFGNAFVNFYLPIEGLELKTQFGWDLRDTKIQEYHPTDLINISAPLGRATIENQNVAYWQEETFLSYNNTFGNHRVNGLLGISWQERKYDNSRMSTVGFSDDTFKYNNVGAASTPDAPTSSYDEWTMNSYFIRGGYTYSDKYMATITGRVDGSSRFGDNNKYGIFPSIGLGWAISNETFMSSVSWIDYLKLRTSYGITGNTEIDTYESLSTIGTGTTLIGGARESSSYPTRLANPDLEWEKTQQFDIGLNANLLDNSISLELDYYHKLTTDLLLDKPIPHTTGYSSVLTNIGEVSNQGVDLLITTQNIRNKDFGWETVLNLNYNKNNIEKLGDNNEDIEPGPWWVSGSQTIIRVGESLSSFYGYERLGTYSTEEAAANSNIVAGTAKRSEGRDIIGKGVPDYTGSFINNFNYKNFDLSVDIQFTLGVEVLQQFKHSTEDRFGYANGLSTLYTDSWTPTNQNTMVQQLRDAPKSGQDSQVDSRWIADGSYLRLNQVSLGYNLDSKVIEEWGLKQFRIYASGENLLLLHDKEFYGFDPEGTSQGTNQWGQNMIFFQYPKPITFTVGVSVKF